jgi:hypothetical protein
MKTYEGVEVGLYGIKTYGLMEVSGQFHAK